MLRDRNDVLLPLTEGWIVLCLLVMQAGSPERATRAAEPLQTIRIGSTPQQSRVAAPLRRGTVLAPQSVAAVDVSDDGRFVAVGTMAFRDDHNFWLLSAVTGKVEWGRYVETWAPAQVRALAEGKGYPESSFAPTAHLQQPPAA